MSRPISATVRLALVLGLAAFPGCSPEAKQADPEQARQTLTQALDAWKKGEPPDTLQKASPAVVVVDRDWKRGARLLDYQVADQSAPSGFDHQFTVTITLDDGGRKKPQKALYNVATHPKRVVVRTEGS